jgi:hypothetical protein
MGYGFSTVFLGAVLMAFGVLLMMNGVRSRGSVRTKSFSSSGPIWFIIFMFGAFLAYIGTALS